MHALLFLLRLCLGSWFESLELVVRTAQIPVVSFLVDQGTIGEWALEGLPSAKLSRVANPILSWKVLGRRFKIFLKKIYLFCILLVLS